MNLKMVMLSKRSQTKKEGMLHNSTYINFRKCKLIYIDRKYVSGCLGMEWMAGSCDQSVGGNFWGDGGIHDLYCESDFTDVYT